MNTPITILGIAGSLRQASYNRAAERLVPEGARLDIFDLAGIPPFNQGNLKDENTGKHIRSLLESLVQWTRRLERGKPAGAKARAS
jgi:NAD(P)H-dependent FMN reductase